MGASYPKALGHNDGNDEPMPVEGQKQNFIDTSLHSLNQIESGNMLIMTLSYVQRTNDQSLITTYVCSYPVIVSHASKPLFVLLTV